MKSVKHEHLCLFTFKHVPLTFIVISTAQTDLGLISRTF